MRWLALPLLLSAANASAAMSGAPCAPIGTFGCWFAPDSIRNENAPTLLVFHRGWRNENERANIPESERVTAARQAFVGFALEKFARENKVAVLVTGAPDLGVDVPQVQAVQSALNLQFSHAVLASHSAGYEGLNETLRLKTFNRVRRVIMLDNMYMQGTLLTRVSALVSAGTPCNGFFTYDKRPSVQGHQAAFGRICRLESHDDFGHYDTVNLCLGKYFNGSGCP